MNQDGAPETPTTPKEQDPADVLLASMTQTQPALCQAMPLMPHKRPRTRSPRHLDIPRYDSEDRAAEDLRMALWFIKKVGGIERAKRVFDAAVTSMTTCRKGD